MSAHQSTRSTRFICRNLQPPMPPRGVGTSSRTTERFTWRFGSPAENATCSRGVNLNHFSRATRILLRYGRQCPRAWRSLGHNATLGYAGLWNNSKDVFAYVARSYSQVLGAIAVVLSMVGAAYEVTTEIIGGLASDFGTAGAKAFRMSAASGYCNSGSSNTISTLYGIQGPSPIDGGLHFVPVFQMEGETASMQRIRGKSRGLLHIIENRPLAADVLILTGVESVDAGLVMGFRTQNAAYSTNALTWTYPETHIGIELGNWD